MCVREWHVCVHVLYRCLFTLAQPRPVIPPRPLTSYCLRQKWRQWISTEYLRTSPPHCMTFHKCRNPQSYIQGYLCQMVCLSFLLPLDLVTVMRLVWTRPVTQAPSIANPSERSLLRYTFGGLRETPGYTWGVPQSRWIRRDIPLKSVSHCMHNFIQLDRFPDPVRSGPLDLNG